MIKIPTMPQQVMDTILKYLSAPKEVDVRWADNTYNSNKFEYSEVRKLVAELVPGFEDVKIIPKSWIVIDPSVDLVKQLYHASIKFKPRTEGSVWLQVNEIDWRDGTIWHPGTLQITCTTPRPEYVKSLLNELESLSIPESGLEVVVHETTHFDFSRNPSQ